MGQILHGSARTTEAICRAIQRSQESIATLARRHSLNPKTVSKWEKRQFVHDAAMGPKQARSTVLTVAEEALIVAFRKRTRQRLVEEGLPVALNDRPHPGRQPKLDGNQKAYLTALACSDPPEGRERWTLTLLAGRLVELGIVDAISGETVRQVLKKATSSPGANSSGAFRE